MKTSELLDEVVQVLDATIRELNPEAKYSPEARAVASFVKNHKVNPQNVCDIIHTMWPDTTWSHRPSSDATHCEWALNNAHGQEDDESGAASARVVVWDVTFPDGSQGMVGMVEGIGQDFWLVS